MKFRVLVLGHVDFNLTNFGYSVFVFLVWYLCIVCICVRVFSSFCSNPCYLVFIVMCFAKHTLVRFGEYHKQIVCQMKSLVIYSFVCVYVCVYVDFG